MTQTDDKVLTVSSSLTKSYTDAYAVAGRVTACGKAIKTAGAVLVILIILAAVITADYLKMFYPLAGLIIAGVAGYLSYWAGLLFCAQGQILKASLDNAVNSSPFMGNEIKAKVLSIGERKMENPKEAIPGIYSRQPVEKAADKAAENSGSEKAAADGPKAITTDLNNASVSFHRVPAGDARVENEKGVADGEKYRNLRQK